MRLYHVPAASYLDEPALMYRPFYHLKIFLETIRTYRPERVNNTVSSRAEYHVNTWSHERKREHDEDCHTFWCTSPVTDSTLQLLTTTKTEKTEFKVNIVIYLANNFFNFTANIAKFILAQHHK